MPKKAKKTPATVTTADPMPDESESASGNPHTKRRTRLLGEVDALLQRFQAHGWLPPDTARQAIFLLFETYTRTGKLDREEALADALEIQLRLLDAEYQTMTARTTAAPRAAAPVKLALPDYIKRVR